MKLILRVDSSAAPPVIGINDAGLKPGHLCDVISMVTEFVFDVAGGHPCDVISVVA
jgi:hypothetical protein